jgi:hypothetical protein
MDPADHHPEPFGEAFSYSSQRAAQMVSLVAAAAEVAAHRITARNARQAARHEQDRRALHEQERAEHAQARTLWAPAHDRQWLAQASLFQAARVWGAAAPYADTEPDAASGMRKTEERLRALHPYAMARYDRLRTEGASSLDAMREAAPLFAREPHARPGPSGTRLRIEPGSPSPNLIQETTTSGDNPAEPSPHQDFNQEAENRGRQIAHRLRTTAQAEPGSDLSPDELAIALEEKTNLPTEVIRRIAHDDSQERVAAEAEHARNADLDHAASTPATPFTGQHTEDTLAADRDTLTANTASTHTPADRAATRLAGESFPCSVADGIRAAVTGNLRQPHTQTHPAAARNAERHASSP